ncbi:hypothetical protein AHAS_Ahas17G0161100 [Arachis hypogaea]
MVIWWIDATGRAGLTHRARAESARSMHVGPDRDQHAGGRVGHVSAVDSMQLQHVTCVGTANIVMYHNGEIIRNTHEGVSFECENLFSFVVPCYDVYGTTIRYSAYVSYSPANSSGRDRTEVYEGMNNDSEEDFEATYEADDKDEDGDGGGEAVVKKCSGFTAISQPMDVLAFMRSLDLGIMHVPKFPEYANIGVADPEEGEFRIGIEYNSRKSFVMAIQRYTISRGVDYVVYELEPQTFYAKCMTYGRGCNWLI